MELDLTDMQLREREEPILHLGKRLLPIDEYSSRTGLSTGLLEQYGRIGIVQIRRYKGMAFVVDVPSRLRFGNTEAGAIEELVDSRNRALQTKKLTSLVAKLTSNSKAAELLPDQIPSLGLFKQLAAASGFSSRATAGGSRFGRVFAKTQFRQMMAVFAVTFAVVSLYASLWLFITGKIQAGNLADMRADVQKVAGKSAGTEQQIETIQNQLDNSITQAGVLRSEIIAAASELELIRQSSKKMVQRLDEQFAKLKFRK